jgi:hypothetical protein
MCVVATVTAGALLAGSAGAQRVLRRAVGTDVRPALCSKKAPVRVPAQSWPPARRALAPIGASAIRLCRYSGLNARPRLALVSSRLVDSRRVVGRLVRDFDRLPRPARGVTACPDDDGSLIVALLVYPAGRVLTISVSLTGCEEVTNGRVNRTAEGFGSPRAFGRQLIVELERLVGGGPQSKQGLSAVGA